MFIVGDEEITTLLECRSAAHRRHYCPGRIHNHVVVTITFMNGMPTNEYASLNAIRRRLFRFTHLRWIGMPAVCAVVINWYHSATTLSRRLNCYATGRHRRHGRPFSRTKPPPTTPTGGHDPVECREHNTYSLVSSIRWFVYQQLRVRLYCYNYILRPRVVEECRRPTSSPPTFFFRHTRRQLPCQRYLAQTPVR